MSLSVLSIHQFWAATSSLTAVVPANKVFLDIAADGITLPYVILSQIGERATYSTAQDHFQVLTFQVTAYAATLAGVNTIFTAIDGAFLPLTQISSSFGIFKNNVLPRGEEGGAYSCVVEYRLQLN